MVAGKEEGVEKSGKMESAPHWRRRVDDMGQGSTHCGKNYREIGLRDKIQAEELGRGDIGRVTPLHGRKCP